MSRLRSQLDSLAAGQNRNGAAAQNRTRARPARAPAARAAAAGRPAVAPESDELSDIRRELARISGTLQSALATTQPPASAPAPNTGQITDALSQVMRQQMKSELNAIHQELASLQASVRQMPQNPHGEELRRIADGVGQLQNRPIETAPDLSGLAGELQQIRSDLGTMATRGQNEVSVGELTQAIEASYAEIASQLQTIGDVHAASGMESIADQIDALRVSVQSMPQPETISAIERQLSEVAAGVHNLAAGGSDTLPHYFEALDARLDEISRGLVAASAHPPVDVNQDAFDRIEARIASLSTTVESLVAAEGAGGGLADLAAFTEQVDAKLEDLSQRIPAFGAVQTADALGRMSDGSASDLAARIDALSTTLERAINSGDGSAGEMEHRIAHLAERVDAMAGAMGSGEVHGQQLASLEEQMNVISAQLGTLGQGPDLSPIEARLGGLEEQIAASRDIAIEVARQAVENVTGNQATGADIKTIEALAEDLSQLTQSSSELKGHSLETFEAVRQSLSVILDRINGLEQSIGQQAYADHGEPSALTDPPVAPAEVEAPPPAAADEVGDELPEMATPPMDLGELPPMADEDQPLEPGSGVPVVDITDLPDEEEAVGPDPDQLVRQANERQQSGDGEATNTADFIAAARRAAQAAANEIEHSEASHAAEEKAAAPGFLKRHRRPLLLAAAVALLAVLVFPLASERLAHLLPGSGGGAVATSEQPAQTPEPVQPQTAVDQPAQVAGEMIEPVSGVADGEGDAIVPGMTPDLAVVETMDQPAGNEAVAEATLPAVAAAPPTSEPVAEPLASVPMPPETVGPIALRQAAAAGDAKALFEVARRFGQGVEGEPDLTEAAQWYERAAERGLAPAQYRLGNLYEKGHGIERDTVAAAQWYEKAAEQGNTLAMHNLAVINAMGVLAEGADMGKAIDWFRKAADRGVMDSQVNLGILYTKGMGVSEDLVEAYKWFAVAAKGGDRDAAEKRDTIAKSMRPDQLDKARGQANLWRPVPLNENANTVEVPTEWKSAPDVTASLSELEMIRRTQALLTDLGYDPGPADGILGARTQDAIRAFQQRSGLPVSGEVSPELVDALEKTTI